MGDHRVAPWIQHLCLLPRITSCNQMFIVVNPCDDLVSDYSSLCSDVWVWLWSGLFNLVN